MHLGPGAFFRSHAAIYVAEAVKKSGGDWGILAASLQSAATRDALKPQGYVYTALEAGPGADCFQVIESIADLLVAPENPLALISAMADPAVKIVTLTVTEKGYCHDPATGELNLEHADIVHDVGHTLPRSAPGFLVRALALRKGLGHRPFTILTCDNLPHNGRVVKNVVLSLAREIDGPLAAWIEAEVRFPSTMVDRIVPATKSGDIARISHFTGYHDAAPVIHEPFRQWVIEDDFVDGERPDFAGVGVEIVGDVAPYETMKLRMLNGTHSSLAYLGYLAGYETIAETTANNVFAEFVKYLWAHEIAPSFTPPDGVDLQDYARSLLSRYQNPAIRHRTWQIAMDGSQKLPQRILATIVDNLNAGKASPGLYLTIAAWMRYVGGVDEKSQPIDVKDPLAAKFRQISDSEKAISARAARLLSEASVFPPSFSSQLTGPVSAALEQLHEVGAKRSVAALLALQGVKLSSCD